MATGIIWLCPAWYTFPILQNTALCIQQTNSERCTESVQRITSRLYLDGARLAYALAAPENELTLPLIAECCDAFYIGGTKCGTLFGEAVVLPRKNTIPHFFTIIKQHGALLAKGWLIGLQFDPLFTQHLYEEVGQPAIEAANTIRHVLRESGYRLFFDTPTNQIFVILPNQLLNPLAKEVFYSFWEKYDEAHTVIRLATSWATTREETSLLCQVLRTLAITG